MYKAVLKRTKRFPTVDAMKKKVKRAIEELTEEDFQHCFEEGGIVMDIVPKHIYI